jgi:DNA polymerase-1
MAKSVTFGLIYGQTTKGLAKKLNISVKKAEEILNDFYANFPSVKKFINKVLSFLYKNFYVVSPVGRIRRFPKITPQAYREAQNFPVQSYASDIANYAAYYIMNMTKKYQAKLVGLVYDCIIVECPEQYKEEVKAIMQYCMKERIKKFFNLCVSLNVEIEEKFST